MESAATPSVEVRLLTVRIYWRTTVKAAEIVISVFVGSSKKVIVEVHAPSAFCFFHT